MESLKLNDFLTPQDFTVYPWSSVLQNSESETIARNIMTILSRTGNIWRKLLWKEYKKERQKDGNFTESEKGYFAGVINYCKSPDTAISFSKAWELI